MIGIAPNHAVGNPLLLMWDAETFSHLLGRQPNEINFLKDATSRIQDRLLRPLLRFMLAQPAQFVL
jgi:hypothetical protein